MAGKKRRKKKTNIKAVLLFLAFIVVLALIFLIIGSGKIYKSSAGNQEEIGRTVQQLKAQEEKQPASFKPAVKPAEITDMTAEEEKIMSTTSEPADDDEIRRWYQGTVIIGDSITVAAQEYGYLGDDVICAKIGVGLENSDDLFEDAISRNPYVVFLTFGLNDIENYQSEVDMFIDAYKKRIDQLKAALPGAVLYVHAVFPVQPGFEDTVAGCEYQPQYNQALEKLCSETANVNFIDGTFILENDQELYDADGIHPVGSFYPKWLTFMADVSGISKADNH